MIDSDGLSEQFGGCVRSPEQRQTNSSEHNSCNNWRTNCVVPLGEGIANAVQSISYTILFMEIAKQSNNDCIHLRSTDFHIKSKNIIKNEIKFHLKLNVRFDSTDSLIHTFSLFWSKKQLLALIFHWFWFQLIYFIQSCQLCTETDRHHSHRCHHYFASNEDRRHRSAITSIDRLVITF